MIADKTDARNDKILERIQDLIAQQMRIKIENVTLEARLQRDIGMDGLDAWEFIETFVTEFPIDMTEFSFHDYFGSERGFDPIVFLWHKLRGRKKNQLIPITVQDLWVSAKSGRWIKPTQPPE